MFFGSKGSTVENLEDKFLHVVHVPSTRPTYDHYRSAGYQLAGSWSDGSSSIPSSITGSRYVPTGESLTSVAALQESASLLSGSFVDPCTGGMIHTTKHVGYGDTIEFGHLTSGLSGIEIFLFSSVDADLKLTSGRFTIVDRYNAIISSAHEVVGNFNGDAILYSGYDGDSSSPGNEYIMVKEVSGNDYSIFVHGYASGDITVVYSWEKPLDCGTVSTLPVTSEAQISEP